MTDQEIVFICGYRKSGTVQLLNLLDGHDELCVYPTDITLLYAYYPVYEEQGHSDQERMDRIDSIVFDYFRNHPVLHRNVDVDRFRNRFIERMKGKELSIKIILPNILKSYAETSGADDGRPIILTESSIEIYGLQFREYWPNARFLHCIRDPRDNYAALAPPLPGYKQTSEQENALIYNIVTRGLLGFEMGLINKSTIGDEDYRFVIYEDLVLNRENTMSELTAFLNIAGSKILNSFTITGEITEGDDSDKMGYRNISQRQLNNWQEQLSQKEVSVIEYYFNDAMDNYGYESAFSIDEIRPYITEYYKWWNYRYLYKDPYT